jgi:DNA-binding GntR family transcriptional regulator
MNVSPTQVTMSPVMDLNHKASRAAFAADEISKLIFAGSLRPGQQLIEEDLAQQLHVSRAPVREALRELSREGLVHVIARRGAFVARMDRAEAAEMYDVRAAIEGIAVGLCAQQIGPQPILELQGLIVQMREAVSIGDIDRYSRLQLEFQTVVWEHTPNRVLREMIRQLWRRSLKLRLIALRLPGRLEEALASYERLLDAIRRRDSRAAEMIRWLALQSAKQALMRGYFSETHFDRRVQLERDLPNLDSVAPPFELPMAASGSPRFYRRKKDRNEPSHGVRDGAHTSPVIADIADGDGDHRP